MYRAVVYSLVSTDDDRIIHANMLVWVTTVGFQPSQNVTVKRWVLGQAIGPLWDFCAPISMMVEL